MSEAQQEKPANAWGQPISEERQAQLQGYLDTWVAETDHDERKGRFARVQLTGNGMSWLAEQSELDEFGRASNPIYDASPSRVRRRAWPGCFPSATPASRQAAVQL